MADIIAVCPVHGPFPTRNLFGGTGSVALKNVTTNCPICGRDSPITDGTYDLVGSAVKAFRAPGVTRDNINALRDIAQAEKDGKLSAKAAEEKAAEISSAFAALIKWTNGNAGMLGLLVAIITLFVSIYAVNDDDLSSAQAHKDFLAEREVQQRIYEALQRQHVPGTSQESKPRPNRLKQSLRPTQTLSAGSPNRHERRKAKAMARRKSRS
jgi:hypothetical protein